MHPLDSPLLGDLYGTDRMRRIFDDRALLQRWLDAEAALARAEGELGVIPALAAEEIARKARAENLDREEIRRGIAKAVHPLVPVIRALAAACEGNAGEFVHWGATTQDILDTGAVLLAAEARAAISCALDDLARAVAALAARRRDTVMAGRTHGQHALPITFGFKAAVWLAELLRHRARLRESAPRLLVGQIAGAVGTLASLGEKGLAVQRRMMELLGLGVPPIAWHTARDGLAEFVSILGMAAATAAKIAGEVIALQKTEVAEVEEPSHEGKVGSSTMPHKRNPMLCEGAVAAARLAMHLVPCALDAMVQEHERDMGPWQMEWAFLPEACGCADAALTTVARVVRGLRLHPARMRANLDLTGGAILSEAVMLALAEKVGRQSAHEIIYRAAMEAAEKGTAFRDAVLSAPEAARHLSPEELDRLLDPSGYTGLAGVFVDRVLDQARAEGIRPEEGR